MLLFSQNEEKRDSIRATQIDILKTDYKDFIIIDKIIYAVTKGDSLVSLNPINEKFNIIETDVLAIAKNSKKRIIVARKDGHIREQDKRGKFIEKLLVKDKVRRIFLDKNDEYVLITSKNIQYKKQIFSPEKDSPMYKSGVSTAINGLLSFDYYFLDKEEYLWFAHDGGEWGGDVCFFNLKTKQFIYDSDLTLGFEKKYSMSKKEYFQELQKTYSDYIKIEKNDTIYKFPYNLNISSGMKGVAYDNEGNLFISSSGMHFFVDGDIIQISKSKIKGFYKSCSCNSVLNQVTKVDIRGKIIDRQIQEYLGPISFNKYNNKTYYYSNKGFFKLSGNRCEMTKEFVFKPWIYWTSGLLNAVGYQMNVIKFEFISEKEMVFLTQKDGIGYFNGKSIKYFK